MASNNPHSGQQQPLNPYGYAQPYNPSHPSSGVAPGPSAGASGHAPIQASPPRQYYQLPQQQQGNFPPPPPNQPNPNASQYYHYGGSGSGQPSGYASSSNTLNENNFIDIQMGGLRRAQTKMVKKEVVLSDEGNFVVDVPVANKLLQGVPFVDGEEFTHL
ncbi:hypothetical protein HDU76_012153, partial [Blyttiomyces sp. JEL0837]